MALYSPGSPHQGPTSPRQPLALDLACSQLLRPAWLVPLGPPRRARRYARCLLRGRLLDHLGLAPSGIPLDSMATKKVPSTNLARLPPQSWLQIQVLQLRRRLFLPTRGPLEVSLRLPPYPDGGPRNLAGRPTTLDHPPTLASVRAEWSVRF